MKISILLTTHNREQEAIYCLKSLLPQKTSDIEIILLDDHHLHTSTLQTFCDENSICYIHTGIQKNGNYLWRMPGYALNIGAKIASADYLIIGNCEILHSDKDCLNKMYEFKDSVSSPIVLRQIARDNFESFNLMPNRFPFFFGMPKHTYIDIGGFDEDFTGTAFDDADFSDRVFSLLKFNEVPSKVIHLWNSEVGTGQRWAHNKNLYETRKGIIKRNTDREWGIL
jgi:GT2 family glycosyltransferase